MSQFSVHRLRGGGLAIRLQSDLGVQTPYLLCAPVVVAKEWTPTARLHIAVDLEDAPHYVIMTQIAALPASALGAEIGSLARHRDDIKRALDLLVDGF